MLKRFIFIAACLFFIFDSTLVFGIQETSDSLLNFERKIDNLIFTAKFKEADSLLKDFLVKDPEIDRKAYIRLKNMRGYLYNRLSKYDSAMQIHIDAQQMSVNYDLEDSYYQSRFYIALTKLFTANRDDALNIFQETQSYFSAQKNIDSLFFGRVLYNIGFINFMKGNTAAAMSYLEKSNKYLSSPFSEIYKIDNLNLLAGLYRRSQNYSRALEHYQMSREIFEKYDRTLDKTILYSGLANVYFEMGEEELGNIYLDSTIYIARQNQNPTELSFAYNLIAGRFEKQGRYQEALSFHKKLDSLISAIQLREKSLNIAQIEENASNRNERIRMESLQKELELQRRNNRTQRAWIFFIVLVCIYLLGSVIVFRKLIYQKNKTQQSLENKNKELEDKSRQIALTQDRLIKSEKMALLGRISAGIAHELNTPIGAIKGNIELIDNVQLREMEMFREISPYITKDEFDLYAKMVLAGVLNAKRLLSKKEVEELRSQWDKLVPKRTKQREEIIDLAVDIQLDYKPERYKALFKNDIASKVFELALFAVNRYESIQTALEALKRVQKILGSFKTYSFKRGWEDLEEFNLKESIETLLSLHQNILKNIKVEVNTTGNLMLYALPDELSQVWSNLITNAAYAMDYEGFLTIEMSGDDKQIKLTIEDSGGGIHQTNKDDIFEPFFTTKPEGEGSGLGLDISRQIIQKHGGRITFENTDLGTKFIVVLPRNREAQETRKVS